MRQVLTRLRAVRPGSVPLGRLAEELASVYGDRPALDQDGVAGLTFRALRDAVGDKASGLRARGVDPGQPVAVAARNGVPQLLAILAVARAGAIPVPVNPQLRTTEVARIIEETGALALVVDGATADLAPPSTIAIDLDDLAAGPPLAPVDDGPADAAAIFTTSGTTGHPKGAELTHRGLLSVPLSGLLVGGALPWTVLEALPVSHIMGFITLVGALAAGLHVHAVERFHPVRFLEEAAALHPEVVVAVPAMYRMLLDVH